MSAKSRCIADIFRKRCTASQRNSIKEFKGVYCLQLCEATEDRDGTSSTASFSMQDAELGSRPPIPSHPSPVHHLLCRTVSVGLRGFLAYHTASTNFDLHQHFNSEFLVSKALTSYQGHLLSHAREQRQNIGSSPWAQESITWKNSSTALTTIIF